MGGGGFGLPFGEEIAESYQARSGLGLVVRRRGWEVVFGGHMLLGGRWPRTHDREAERRPDRDVARPLFLFLTRDLGTDSASFESHSASFESGSASFEPVIS